jgi:hypothetical protein
MNGTAILKNSTRPTPYDTGKVKIGVFYEPPKPALQQEELALQHALLSDEQTAPFFQRLLTKLMRS